jgi:hypothetical protein
MNPLPTLCPSCGKPVTPEQDYVDITMFRPRKVVYIHRVCP